jgi:hypothetical protein
MVLFSRFFIRKRIASVAMTSFALADDPASTDHFRRTMPIQYVADWPNHSEEQPFLSENDAAMNKIKADRTIAPTGDVDKELVAIDRTAPSTRGRCGEGRAQVWPIARSFAGWLGRSLRRSGRRSG